MHAVSKRLQCVDHDSISLDHGKCLCVKSYTEGTKDVAVVVIAVDFKRSRKHHDVFHIGQRSRIDETSKRQPSLDRLHPDPLPLKSTDQCHCMVCNLTSSPACLQQFHYFIQRTSPTYTQLVPINLHLSACNETPSTFPD